MPPEKPHRIHCHLDRLLNEHNISLTDLAELVGVAAEYDSMPEFLEQVSLVADTDNLPDEDDPTAGEMVRSVE